MQTIVKRYILRWTLIGLFIRFLIMPFSFHGDDIFYTYYFPYKFIEQGTWNPYLLSKMSFPHNPYYPPVIFLVIPFFFFLFKPFLPEIHNLFSGYESWAFTGGANTIHYVDTFSNYQLLRTLFIFKLPYLIFDFGIAWLVLKMLKNKEKEKLLFYKVWMLNPFILHSCYALGQVDIIPAFLIMAVVYCIYNNRKYCASILLSFAILTKIFPAVLLPPTILLLGDNFKQRLKLFLLILAMSFLIILPFYLSSPKAILEALFFGGRGGGNPRHIVFAIIYFATICVYLFRIKKESINFDFILTSFIVFLMLFYSFYNVTIRYFIPITSLLVYLALKHKVFWIYNLIFFLTLFELRACSNSQQWGLFAALHPEFFSSLPISDSYLNLILNVKYIHQFMYRIFIISSLIMVMHIFMLNRKIFKFSSATDSKK